MAAEGNEVYRLACFELRGGNQQASYLAELPGLAGWVWCRPLPPATRGGDLHYLSVCSRGFISRVALADVAGHGENVSSVADRLREALRKHADNRDQSVLMRELSDAFRQGADGVEYATAFVLSYYAHSGELLFTNAGHLPPLWYRAAEREWGLMQESTPYAKKIDDLPLGVISGTPYTQTAVQLGFDDLLLLYTDGITESRGPAGERLGQGRLLLLAKSLPTDSPIRAGQALLAAVEAFRGPTPAADDETVVVLQRSRNSPADQERLEV